MTWRLSPIAMLRAMDKIVAEHMTRKRRRDIGYLDYQDPFGNTLLHGAVVSGETTEVQALVQHPMDSGFDKNAQGHLIPPHHIEVVEFVHADRTVFTALWGPAVSRDPYVKFSFKGARKGDDLKVSWVDNKGATDSLVAKIQ